MRKCIIHLNHLSCLLIAKSMALTRFSFCSNLHFPCTWVWWKFVPHDKMDRMYYQNSLFLHAIGYLCLPTVQLGQLWFPWKIPQHSNRQQLSHTHLTLSMDNAWKLKKKENNDEWVRIKSFSKHLTLEWHTFCPSSKTIRQCIVDFISTHEKCWNLYHCYRLRKKIK